MRIVQVETLFGRKGFGENRVGERVWREWGFLGTCRNEPNVHESRQEANPTGWQGTELSVTILGNWQYYRAKILKYLRQIAVITPYAQFAFAYVAEDEKNSLRINFVRRTNKMPKPPKVRSMPRPGQAAPPCLPLACLHEVGQRRERKARPLVTVRGYVRHLEGKVCEECEGKCPSCLHVGYMCWGKVKGGGGVQQGRLPSRAHGS